VRHRPRSRPWYELLVSRSRASVPGIGTDPWDTPSSLQPFGRLGNTLIQRCDEFTDRELDTVFGIVEEVLVSPSQSLKDAVATGLLEAVLHSGDELPLPLARVMRFVGPQARAYCKAWNDFCRVEGKAGR
jgi:hypothetical protein